MAYNEPGTKDQECKILLNDKNLKSFLRQYTELS